MKIVENRPISALTIAGSDSGGGAGIQADLKTFAAHGVHGLSALAALTAQHTRGVTAVHVPPLEFLKAQIEACFDDFSIGAVKLGMLASSQVIQTVASALAQHGAGGNPLPVVLDPVMVATSGAKLLQDDALQALRDRLLPACTILTPNLPEAELLLGRKLSSVAAMHEAAADLRAMGAGAVLLKGGHLEGTTEVTDVFHTHGVAQEIIHPRLSLNAHGTGCTLASAIAANLCLGRGVLEACLAASDYVHAALLGGYRPGRSDILVLDHFGASPLR
ncbi:MAG: bifunctional hydroxymethylpyrimidine kinase/phosphomethylpyrimidine kinase [Pseudoxanthomonas sp.]